MGDCVGLGTAGDRKGRHIMNKLNLTIGLTVGLILITGLLAALIALLIFDVSVDMAMVAIATWGR